MYLADSTQGYPEFDGDGDSVSRGGMSPDLGEMWRYGCPKSPDWDSEVEVSRAISGYIRATASRGEPLL